MSMFEWLQTLKVSKTVICKKDSVCVFACLSTERIWLVIGIFLQLKMINTPTACRFYIGYTTTYMKSAFLDLKG